MENVSKALEMAAGVMLGVMLMALVAYFFTTISSWPKNQEDIMSVEQLSKFNLEYEVYNKSIMYGVDVISCLNKVVSNNEKYAKGGAFLGGNAGLGDYRQRENYWINVKLRLKDGSTNLNESLSVYYINDNNKEVLRFNNSALKISNIKKLSNAVNKVDDYTKLNYNTPIGPYDGEVEIFNNLNYKSSDGYINLIVPDSSGNISDMNQNFTELLDSIQTLGGDQGSANLTFVVTNTTNKDYKEWTKIIWKTALYDLKNRKFKCNGINYNDTTGRVNEIIFEEI